MFVKIWFVFVQKSLFLVTLDIFSKEKWGQADIRKNTDVSN